jgi:hypothetical protein
MKDITTVYSVVQRGYNVTFEAIFPFVRNLQEKEFRKWLKFSTLRSSNLKKRYRLKT